MIYCYEHWLVKPHGWKSMLCYTLLPMPPGLMKQCWRGRKEGEMKSFVLVFVSLFYFALVWFYIFSFFFGGAVDTMGGYGGTMRWAELGFIMWNSQRISQEFILKTSKIKKKMSCSPVENCVFVLVKAESSYMELRV